MPRAPKRALSILAGLVFALLMPKLALAAPSARLVYSRSVDAEACPDEDALRRAVAALVGYDTFFPWAKRVVLATITRQGDAFVASVDLIDERGIRHGGHELRTQGACAALLDTVALAVAIAIDPRLVLPPPATASQPVSPVEPPSAREEEAPATARAPTAAASPPAPLVPVAAPVTEPPVDRDPAAPSHAPQPASFFASLGATGALGITPNASLGGTLGAGVRWRFLSVALEGFAAPPISSTATGGGTYSAWPLLASLVPCVHLGPAFGCGVLQAGAVFASSEGSGARSASYPWGAAGGRVGVLIPLRGPWLLRARADLLGDMSPAKLVFNGQLQSTDPLVAGAFGVDAVVRFP